MAPSPTLPALAAGAAALAVAVGGCGSADGLLHHRSEHAVAVSADVVNVIRDWSTALRDGDVAAAARYFRIPSVFFGGTAPRVELRSFAQVEAINAALPCGATFLSAQRHGRYVNVLFRLGDRRGPGGEHGCGSGTGQTARTDFVIRDGRIAQWLRAPDEPGDNGAPRSRPPAPPATTPDGGTPVV